MSHNFYTVNICTETALLAIEWLELSLKDNEPYHMKIAKNAILNDPFFRWKGVEPKLRRKYNYRLNKATLKFEI